MSDRAHYFLVFILIVFYFSCSEPEPEDCAGIINGSSICGCTESSSSNYDSTATHDDGSCLDCAGVEIGNNICGCTDSTASNYDSTATHDDGSCLDCAEVEGGDAICGCTDNTATNYNLDATFDDGSCSYCGVDTSFSRVIQGTGGYDIVRSSNCSYVVCGTDGKTMLLKIDEQGDEIWNRTYSEISGSHWGNAVNNTTDGGYIIGGKQNVIKADSLGEMEWFKQLSYSVTHYVEDVIETFAGDYIVVGGVGGDPIGGHSQKGKAFILRMSEGGGVQWVKRYGISDTPMNSFWGVVQADDGGFVLAGEKLQDRNFEFYDHFWIMKTDGNGNEQWSIESGGNLWDEAKDIVKLSDDSYIVAGKISLSSTNLNMRVMRVSSSGDILWQNNHGNNNYETATSLTLSENEDIVTVVGYTRSSSSSPFKYRIWGVDVATGQVLWNRIHGGSQKDEAYGVAESYDNGFAIVGRSYSFGSDRVTWLVKTDSLGNVN